MAEGLALRMQALSDLLVFQKPLPKIADGLVAVSWDCETPLYEVRKSHLVSVLVRFNSGDLSAGDLERWADLIEVREDLFFEKPFEALIGEIVYELANPILTGGLDRARAGQLLAKLNEC